MRVTHSYGAMIQESLSSKFMRIKIKRLHPCAKLPTYGSAGAAAFDFYALDNVALYIGQPQAVRTGIAIELPEGHALFISPRSGLALNRAVTVANSPGLVDSDYRGDVRIIMIAHDIKSVAIMAGDRIAQGWVIPVPRVEWVEVDELAPSVRGANGLGSTGR